MSSTPHPFAPEEIMAHLDGELPADRAQVVSAHVDSCAECSSLLANLQGVSQQASTWRVEPPASYFNKKVSGADLENSVKGSFLLSGPMKRPRLQVIGWATGLAACVLLILAISIPNLLRSRMAANEASSVGSLRTINAAAETYARTYGHYPKSLKDLGPSQTGQPSENGAGLIDPVLAQGAKSGYLYSYHPNSGRYTVDASPVQAGTTGKRTFSTDQTGAVDADGLALDGSNGPSGSSNKAQNSTPLNGRTVSELQALVPSAPMIARTVSLSLIAKDFESTRASLDAILVRYHGYAANLSSNTPQGSARSIEASLRIPAPQLAAALAELKSIGHVENENQNGEEVTQQHADLVARLKNSRETEQRLQAILTQRTGKISDVLEVEQEIARVRGEIEQMEAEQKNLEHRVDFATIDLKISEEYKAKLDSTTPSISTQLHNALVNGYRNVADTLIALLLFFAEYGPILLFWALLLFLPAWLVWRRWLHATAAI